MNADRHKEEFCLLGILFSILAGAAMSVQGVMDTRLGDRIGLYESNVLVQGVAFALSAIALIFLGKGNFGALGGTNKVYLLGGVLGIVITITVMLGIKSLGPTIAISVILISQLLVAALIDAFGIFDSQRIPFDWKKFTGITLMIGGMLLFKWKN
jgi:bacterial/archaeal transporter family-2 protein